MGDDRFVDDGDVDLDRELVRRKDGTRITEGDAVEQGEQIARHVRGHHRRSVREIAEEGDDLGDAFEASEPPDDVPKSRCHGNTDA